MAWKVVNIVKTRMSFVSRHLSGERMSDLCREFGISRKTGYKFVKRYKQSGDESALADHSREALRKPNKTPQASVDAILALKKAFPSWGAKKIHAELPKRHKGVKVPARSTIHCYLRANGLVDAKRTRNKTPRYSEKLTRTEVPNVVWCADFKGEFRLGNGRYCYPLTVTDFASRYLLRCSGLDSTKGAQTIPVWEAIFAQYGLPEVILTDNGTPFATRGIAGLSRLSVWWLKLGIRPERIEPGHPEQNGRHERMHLTLKREATRPAEPTLLQQQDRFEKFVDTFNSERPHEALNMQRPAEVYTASPRIYRGCTDPEYPLHDDVRRVHHSGHVHFQHKKFFLGAALQGELVGFRQLSPTRWLTSFCQLNLGVFDTKLGVFTTSDKPFA